MTVTVTTEALLDARSAQAVDTDADGRVLVRSDLDGTWQLFELPAGGGELRALTALPGNVGGRYVQGRRLVVVSADTDGDERHQLYLLDPDGPAADALSSLRALTSDPRFVHEQAGTSPDGRLVAFTTNRRNGVDFDAWIVDIDSGEERCVWSGGGWCHPGSGFSPDGRWLSLLLPGHRPLDNALLLVDVATGAVSEPEAHVEEAASVDAPVWIGPDRFVCASDAGRDTAALVRFDLAGDTRTVIAAGDTDLDVAASGDGSVLLVMANDDGHTTAHFADAATGDDLGPLPLPEPGVVATAYGFPRAMLTEAGDAVTFTFSSPTRPSEVWRHDRSSGTLEQLTRSPGAVHPSLLSSPERHRIRSFDGEELSVYLFRPIGPTDSDRAPDAAVGALLPVALRIHGGPESQSMWQWSPLVQAIASAGIAVAVPNVRGSTGYGKRFAGLDDTVRRLDSVADLGAIHDWLASVGLDPARAALTGGSYGGYMTLAGCAFQPGRWAAGIDEVGMSSLVTFLEHTSDYRRSHREQEYGSLAQDRDFLQSASPLSRIDDIRAALFVIHGANDPRVPLSEAEQLVASLRERGIPCELRVYADEGHGLSRLANKLDAYPAAVTWLAGVLGVAPA